MDIVKEQPQKPRPNVGSSLPANSVVPFDGAK